ncbi:MAG: helix-turn-helix transcriptional regulator [Acidobacteriota bacterium]
MSHLCELRRLKAEVDRLIPIVQQAPRIRKLFCERDLHQLSLTEAAHLCNMSTADFRRKFHLTTGTSFHRFVILLRVAEAMELLARPDLTITHVALECGFGSLNAFEYAFRRLVHSSPGQCGQCLRQGLRTCEK